MVVLKFQTIFLIFLLVLFLLNLINLGDAAKILGIFGMCAHSHFTLGFRLMKELADKGHQVIFINPYPQKIPIKNLRDISVAETCAALKDVKENLYELGRMSYIGQLHFVHNLGMVYTETIFNSTEIQKLLSSDEKFDLVVMEHFMNDALTILAHKFKCPLIWLAPGPTTIFNNHLLSNPSPASYVPNLLSNFGAEMNFQERMINAAMDLIGGAFVEWKMIPAHNTLLHKYIPDAPNLEDILYNGNFMLLTSDVSISDPVPLQPNIKAIGGYHVGPIKTLPDDIKQFLDNATHGVILFSMGSNLKSSDFPVEKKNAILKAFSKLKQKVLWKFETDLPEKPSNVKIMKWLPQQDILAHPNIVLFISHVGLLGTIEAVYHGVPILGLPVYWDQTKNIEDAVRKGFGLKLSFEDITDDSFENALTEILNNPKYSENAKTRSRVMHDRPMKQLDEAVYWIEYVIRHNGATFLKSPGVYLKWYQRYLIDVLVFILSAVTVIIVVTKLCWNFLSPKTTRRRANNVKKNK